MIIHEPDVVNRNGQTILFSRIECTNSNISLPEYLWYRFPNEYAINLTCQSDPFLLPALYAAMHFRESLNVRGFVSPQLAYHLDEYQFVQNYFFPNEVFPIDIQYQYLAVIKDRPKAVGVAFSGGVDSFFTIRKHSLDNEISDEYRITHALFINKFDLVHKDNDRYQALFSRFHKALKTVEIDLIPIETNAYSFIVPHLKLARYYIPVLAGSAMVFAGLFKKFFVSNSWDYYQLRKIPNSSNPISDRLLSTETMDFEHFGANFRRTEKIEAILDYKLARENLRVCGSEILGQNELNCSKCGKCLRTMIPIYVFGRMHDFQTFSKPLRHHLDILRWARKFEPFSVFLPEIVKLTKVVRSRLLPILWLAIFLGKLRVSLLALVPDIIKGWLSTFGYFVDLAKEEHAFENIEVVQLIYAYFEEPNK